MSVRNQQYLSIQVVCWEVVRLFLHEIFYSVKDELCVALVLVDDIGEVGVSGGS